MYIHYYGEKGTPQFGGYLIYKEDSVMALLLGIAFLVTVVLVDNDVVEVKRA